MRLKILGSAAGGGFPQWNCACRNCGRLRGGSLRGSPRTQTQLAFSIDAEHWDLVSASPDLRSQILAMPELSPRNNGADTSPIRGVYLTSADADSVMGLLHLREFSKIWVRATPGVRQVLQQNRIFRVIERANLSVLWQPLSNLEGYSPPPGPSFWCQSVPLGGSYPDYVSDELRQSLAPEDAVVGISFGHGGKSIFFAPSISGQDSEWKKPAESSDLALIDGTFWSDDELIQTGRSKKTAREIGHLPLSGPSGLLGQYPNNVKGRKVLIHINNTNPILDEDSREYHQVREAGWEVARDGMEFTL